MALRRARCSGSAAGCSWLLGGIAAFWHWGRCSAQKQVLSLDSGGSKGMLTSQHWCSSVLRWRNEILNFFSFSTRPNTSGILGILHTLPTYAFLMMTSTWSAQEEMTAGIIYFDLFSWWRMRKFTVHLCMPNLQQCMHCPSGLRLHSLLPAEMWGLLFLVLQCSI